MKNKDTNKTAIQIFNQDFKAAMGRIYAMPSEKRKIILLENDLPDNY